jgi:hypothetical protein
LTPRQVVPDEALVAFVKEALAHDLRPEDPDPSPGFQGVAVLVEEMPPLHLEDAALAPTLKSYPPFQWVKSYQARKAWFTIG